LGQSLILLTLNGLFCINVLALMKKSHVKLHFWQTLLQGPEYAVFILFFSVSETWASGIVLLVFVGLVYQRF